MIDLDFWDSDSLFYGLQKIYGLSDEEVINLRLAHSHDEDLIDFVSDLKGYDASNVNLSNVRIKCKHITTCADRCESIKRHGLLNLLDLLQIDCDLTRFLKKHHIEIDEETRRVIVNGHLISISQDGQLYSCLYYDNGEVEAFYQGSDEEILRYSVVRYYPEIIMRLANDLSIPELIKDWENFQTETYCIEFYVGFWDTSYINGADGHELAAWNKWLLNEAASYIIDKPDLTEGLGIKQGVKITPSKITLIPKNAVVIPRAVKVTEQDLQNNPGVDPEEIAEVKSHYHFHKLASVSLHHHTLICTFAIDPDPSSIFYTPLERGAAPVRFFDLKDFDGVDGVVDSIEEGEVEIMPDALSLRVGDHYIPSEEIFGAV